MRRQEFVTQQELLCPEFPEMLLPSEFFSDRLLVGRASGEVALMWAVFSHGLEQYWRMAADPSAWDSQDFQEDESWVMADDEEWPFSFVNLCENFGLPAQSVRSVLVAWKRAHQNGGRGSRATTAAVSGPPKIAR